jgi:hypothetical protein
VAFLSGGVNVDTFSFWRNEHRLFSCGWMAWKNGVYPWLKTKRRVRWGVGGD